MVRGVATIVLMIFMNKGRKKSNSNMEKESKAFPYNNDSMNPMSNISSDGLCSEICLRMAEAEIVAYASRLSDLMSSI